MKNKHLLFVFSLFIMYSCNNEQEISMESVKSESAHDVIISGNEVINMPKGFYNIIPLDEYITPNDSLFREISKAKESFLKSTQLNINGPFILNGYTDKVKIRSYVLYSGSNAFGLSAGVSYVVEQYKYRYRFTVPKGASVITPEVAIKVKAFVRPDTDMGWLPQPENTNETVNNTVGYIAQRARDEDTSTYDVYYMITIVDEIDYDILGRQINKAYRPACANHPDYFKFQYIWTLIEWE